MKNKCLHPIRLSHGNKEVGFVTRTVPCGKCANCLRRRRLQWIPRLLTEFNNNTDNYFVTLTYSDEHMPFDADTNLWCFNKKHCQDYIKRLRYYVSEPFKYFLVSEYGKKSGRPHYHLLLFNFKPKKEFGDYFNVLVDLDLWQFDDIDCDVHPLTGRLITYSTKYILEYVQNNLNYERPFMLCSKGLGKQVLDDDKLIKFIRNNAFRTGQFFYHVNGYSYPLPRYLRNKIFTQMERFKLDFDYRHRSLTPQEIAEMLRDQDFLDRHHITSDFEEFSANVALNNISKVGKI